MIKKVLGAELFTGISNKSGVDKPFAMCRLVLAFDQNGTSEFGKSRRIAMGYVGEEMDLSQDAFAVLEKLNPTFPLDMDLEIDVDRGYKGLRYVVKSIKPVGKSQAAPA